MGVERELMIVSELGLHARPATQIVNLVNQFESEIMLTFRGITVDMKSIMGVLSLGIAKGSTIVVSIEGFDEKEAMSAISKKIIHRHPHIYGDVKVNNDDDVKRNWEQLKLKEGKGDKTILSGVPNSLPSMVKALRIQEKVKHVGFEWENKEQVWEKVKEEENELVRNE